MQLLALVLMEHCPCGKRSHKAEFQNLIDSVSKLGNPSCLSASISWNPQKGELQQSDFILGFRSNSPLLNSPRFGSLTRIIKGGFQLPNLLRQRKRVITFLQLLGHKYWKEWQMEWDLSGMTLASTGSDGVVKLWQSNLNGVWHEQAILAPAG